MLEELLDASIGNKLRKKILKELKRGIYSNELDRSEKKGILLNYKTYEMLYQSSLKDLRSK